MEVYVLPLSVSQKQFWYREIMFTGNTAYHIPIGLNLLGDLDFTLLEKCFRYIINRHEILRTTFALENGEPVQLVRSEQQFHLQHRNLELPPEKWSDYDRLLTIKKILEDESRQLFDLIKGPLLRATLYKISNKEHILLVNLHHIISDGWSLGIFIQELTQLYVSRAEISLPELPIQYGDYAEWQETYLQTQRIQDQLAYWQKKLALPLPILDLPSDKNRPALQTFSGAVLRKTLPRDLIDSLEAVAAKEGVTFFMVTLAVYQILLFRYSGQTDIIIGTPCANRNRGELKNLIGCFINTLPIVCSLTGQLSFKQVLQQVASTCVEAFANQEVPLEIIIDKLNITRDHAHSQVFQSLFALQNAPIEEIKLPGLTVQPVYLDNGGAKFDLSLMLEPTFEKGWIAALEYNTDLFTAHTAEDILRHYEQLLSAVIGNLDTKIDTLPWLNTEERRELLSFGSSASDQEVEATNLVDVFSHIVNTYGEKVALIESERTLTYQKLNQISNQLASHLIEKGVGAETRVGIFQERSLELVASILAVLKCGATYVPLDPQYPAERLNFIAQDSGIRLVITTEPLRAKIPGEIPELLLIDTMKPTNQLVHPISKIFPEQAAYIIYTSGSTGKPKGCLVTHKNVLRLMRNTQKWFEFNEKDVWTMFHSFAFDFSVWEMWGALLYGGKLVIVPYLESRSPHDFRQLLATQQVTILNQTPSAFRQLIRADQEFTHPLNNLRAIIFGGEALELQSLKPWIERYGDSHPRLINMYGITETTVHVTYRQILAEDILENRGSVIGIPIPDLCLYILDRYFEPVPYGVAGEIYVGGMGVSRGYLNRPSLTAERFIPNPISQKPGARLYRTGDLARRLRNGDIEYLGRCDSQVKIRGFRIELAEIEAAINKLTQVSESVVTVHSTSDQDRRLVAYIVLRSINNNEIDRNELRKALKESLPDYMVPAAFVFLDAIPLTNQGKINRGALPLPDWDQSTTKRSFIPPETDAQKALCHIWQRVLGIEEIGIEDNFFDLGGDSILALRVITEMRSQGWILTPKQIFEQQTVQRLALAIQEQTDLQSFAAAENNNIPTGEVPLSPIQQWFFDLKLSNPHHWNQTLLLQVDPSLQVTQVATAIKVVFAYHDNFRLRFQKESQGWRQFYVEKDQDDGFPWEVVDLDLKSEIEQNSIMKEVREKSEKSLNLTEGPVYMVKWFNLGANRPSQLLIVIHHLIIDGVSWRILLQDLVDVIGGNKLSFKTTSWQKWCEFIHGYVNSYNIQSEKLFWQNTLARKTAKLPLDFPESLAENLEYSVSTVSCQLTAKETLTLLTTANKTYRTNPQELLIAALGKTLADITQNSYVQIMLEGHGREELSSDLDVTRTLGWFTTLYPVSLDLPKGDSQTEAIREIIKSVKEQLRAVPQRGFGYGILKYLDQETKPLLASAVEISFNYLGQVRNEGGARHKFFTLLNSQGLPTRDPQATRPHIIDVNAIVVEGELRIDWLYSSNLHQASTINRWVSDFKSNLLKVVNFCTEVGVGEYTPTDFTLAQLNQSKLDILQNQYPHLEDIYPLSPLQQGMLFHAIYEPDQGIYFEQVTGKIIGKLDVDKFAYAWQVIVDRHPVLRTCFVWEEQDQPLQIVNKGTGFSLIYKEWRDLSPAQQIEKMGEYLVKDKEQGFNLNDSPLMRFTLICLDDSTWQWLWSHHHIILDGWSLPVIFKEVLSVYQSATERVPHSLLPVPPYRHYIQWLTGRDQLRAKQFWQKYLVGISTGTRLAWEIPDLENNSSAYREVELRLDDLEFELVQKMAQSQRLTLNTIVQSAWAMCLQKHGAGEDVMFGVTVAGRPPELSNMENMVGLFINTLPMRVKIDPSLSLADWLQNIQQQHLEMREYEYSKLADIQKDLNLAGLALFESLLVFENYPVDQNLKKQLPDFRVDDIQFYERTNYPLTVGVIPDQGLLLKLNYQTKFLSGNAAENLILRFRNIIVNMTLKPEQTLAQVLALSISEREGLINASESNSIIEEGFKTAHQLFESYADLQPDSIAVVCDEYSITYGELENRANNLATQLVDTGIAHESIVGLYFDPGIEYIISLLAVLKVGGAFLPLDRSYPDHRLRFIIENSQVSVILTNNIIGLPLQENLQVLDIRNLESKGNHPRLNLKVRPENLAYVIYTSGSTGNPKGVLVTHSGIQNLVQCQTMSFGVTAKSCVYQFAALNFDSAIAEIFMSLGSGAVLYIQSQAHRSPGSELWQKLTNWEITHVTLPPSLVASIDTQDLPRLQTLILAGEAVSGDLLRRWGRGQRRCFNAYGPTEATVCASLIDCTHLLGEPSIGKGIPNVEIYLLDSFLEPVVPGVIGEIYIGGIGLARGYLQRPGLTAALFIPHPFTKTPGSRLYKTGDRAVYDPEGNIRFIGRYDNQVKINGYRIELGEIEAALTKHEAVESALAVLRTDLIGRNRILGYALIKPVEGREQPNDLKEHLSKILPDYMIPGAVIVVDEWPLTPNGKIDRQRLATPDFSSTEVIPKTDIEQIFAQIWIELLGLETVNPQDNFFEMGGDSIISLQMVTRARAAGWEISPKDIFEGQTLSRIATRAKLMETQTEIVEPLTGFIPLSPIQNWFFAQNFLHPHHWNQSVALTCKQPVNTDALVVALHTLVSHHDIFRIGFAENDGEWQQFYVGGAKSPNVKIIDFSHYLPTTQLTFLNAALETEHSSFQLDRPPLIRILYGRNLNNYGDVLFIFAHHLIIDAVSWRILLEDLNQAYQKTIDQLDQLQQPYSPVSLPVKTASYRSWTTQLQSLAHSSQMTQDIIYWKDILSTVITPLPVDKLGNNSVDSTAIISTHLSVEQTLTLVKEATATYHASVQEIMLAALLNTLISIYKSDQWLIDLEGHGREDIGHNLDLSRTVGWFTCLYPILLKQPTNPDNHEILLKEIKNQLRTIPHHGISFGLLRYLNLNQPLKESKNADISFNYLGSLDSPLGDNHNFSVSDAPVGAGVFALQQRTHILAINAKIQDKILQVEWSYSRNIHYDQTIENIAKTYLQSLGLYLTNSDSANSSFYSASDFQLVDLSESELGELLEDLE
ncbi:non-ribosomal peptide synthetase [Cylindrospermopsis raciborskii]|uniref:non-ribosomal peptide synthetase n=1 Tax=Cylindrospermopsis raciborskii TaxID=77022 RepID=UPI001F482FEF|nr:non-ribosomal peptide synthetase [Cylindrospermopsis raciborskii]UJS03239.1 amino acid adenylation domain-containing protein [Cylindrospermopsis raciborskii KLL07]